MQRDIAFRAFGVVIYLLFKQHFLSNYTTNTLLILVLVVIKLQEKDGEL